MKFSNKILWVIALMPSFAFAQAASIQALINIISLIINRLIPITVAAALLFFLWGLARFIFASGSDVDKEKGKNIMLWGIIALFVMVSVWGIVAFIQNSFIDAKPAGGDIIPDLIPGKASSN